MIGVFGYMAPTMLERAVQTDPTLLRYASAITEQKKCWESLGQKFGRFANGRNMQYPTMLHPFAGGLSARRTKTCRKE